VSILAQPRKNGIQRLAVLSGVIQSNQRWGRSQDSRPLQSSSIHVDFYPSTVSEAFTDRIGLSFLWRLWTDSIVGDIRLEEVVIVGRRLDDVREFFEAGRREEDFNYGFQRNVKLVFVISAGREPLV